MYVHNRACILFYHTYIIHTHTCLDTYVHTYMLHTSIHTHTCTHIHTYMQQHASTTACGSVYGWAIQGIPIPSPAQVLVFCSRSWGLANPALSERKKEAPLPSVGPTPSQIPRTLTHSRLHTHAQASLTLIFSIPHAKCPL